MPSAVQKRRSKRFNIRATASEHELIRTVAEMQGVSITDFILESARSQAEQLLADQKHFVVSEKEWRKFVEALDRPAQVKPNLRKLLTEKSVLEVGQIEEERSSLARRKTHRRA